MAIKSAFGGRRKILLCCFGFAFLSSCAHSFYYAPEIDGAGATKAASQSIDFKIPPSGNGEIKMRIRSLGTETVRHQKMFVVRIAFARPKDGAKPSAREFMDPAEQTIQLGLGTEPQVKVAYIRTKSRKGTVLDLTGVQHEAIDLLFPFPKGDSGPQDVERILFHWKLHYGNNLAETQTTRFDRYDAAPQQSAEPYPEDPDYPYDVSPLQMPGWEIDRDPFWWPIMW